MRERHRNLHGVNLLRHLASVRTGDGVCIPYHDRMGSRIAVAEGVQPAKMT